MGNKEQHSLSDESLVSSKELTLLSKLFRSSGEGIMLFSKEGIIEILNPRAEEMFGYAREELVGQSVEVLVPEKISQKHRKDRENYVKSPSPRPMGQGLDLRGRRKDGSLFPLEISLNYLTHESEVMVVAFITDITIRKRNEQMVQEQQKKLEEYSKELERKVKTRTSELEHMNLGLQSQIQERKLAEDALKKSLQDLKKAEQEILESLEREKELGVLKSRFVSMASHEFRTPLTTILSSANLIAKYTETEQQKSREKHVERIRKSVLHLTNILNDFLSIEKLESGAQKINKTHIDLKAFCQDVVEETAHVLKKGQELAHQVEASEINTDENVLKNILINLISNASKYSGEGDLIELTVMQEDGRLTISVKDNGIGIPEKEQKNLFQRFFRAGNVTNIQGTGLGLNIVKNYTELLGGSISFISEESNGSTFTVKLPTN